ncbi:MAG: holo-ACP synthase [Coriobacteriia bacterium]|nr:holo-ACP synthase [Coriobacteriia bacterium]
MEDSQQRMEGQVGLGLDVVEIQRMKRILQRTPSFARRVFSPEEQAYCESKAVPAAHFATRFAAKEAVLKALGTGFADGISVRDVEVRRTPAGKPYVVLSGRAKEVAASLGVRELPISLSYTHDEAVACAMAITQESEKHKAKRLDPMAELTAQFKDARALLDDLGAPEQPDQPDQPEQTGEWRP